MSESLSRKREGFQDNATRIKGKFLLLARVRAPVARPTQWYAVRERWAQAVTQFIRCA